MRILVINCGSSTLKYALFDAVRGALTRIASAIVEWSGGAAATVERALATLPFPPDVIAHRVVHGGDQFVTPVAIDDDVILHLAELVPLAPLHNAASIDGIAATRGIGVPQIAVFDTAFFAGLPERASRCPIPSRAGIRRYGFHGWSHRSATERCGLMLGSPAPTLVTLHLGSGCSAAAIDHGRAIDTSMGYSPLEGLMMGTRPGDLDAGVLLHLQQQGMSAVALEHMLYHESGLYAIAGSSDMRALLAREDAAARDAVELFCYRIVKYVGAYLAALEGRAQAIVFTGGIGSGSAEIRRRVSESLAWTGLRLDPARNARDEARISDSTSSLVAFAFVADEESAIAAETLRWFSR
ncbi:MAG: acetate kinase [Gemmatimonadota bacterium]